jgi:EAL domain-containing protein (putative c-di-GMP-specific phosphodiesterase class I)/FixJ family two-component response regulator
MSPPRILILDDDEQVCFVAGRALESIGQCDAVHSVAAAVRALEHGAYDLVLVDVALPGESGMDLLDRLRGSWPQTAALMLSGATDLSIAKEALDRGAIGYVVKPFRVRDLRIQVTAALASADRSTNVSRALNRGRIAARLGSRLAESAGAGCFVAAVEHVSLLNASYGVDAVDRLCDCVEERLRNAGPTIEVLGRLGPATFLGVLAPMPGTVPSESADALHRALAVPAIVDGRRIPIAARVGVALASPGEDPDTLVNRAEGAVVEARDRGQPFAVSDCGALDHARVQQELLEDAATAIHRAEIYVAYQPQQDLATGQCVGVEALARWHHPTRGDVPASIFIPLAERMDLIDELDAQVLRAACADIARLRREHQLSDLRVSVNASATELRDREYPTRVERALREGGLPAPALRLEVTESVTLDETEVVDGVLADLQTMGVALSIDDFGTGYSSFSILTRVPWSEIKLDRSLTAQYRDPRGREMLRAIINYGTSLGVDVIAEGIESVPQLDALQTLGCRYAQGYLLGRPQPITALVRALRRVAA